MSRMINAAARPVNPHLPRPPTIRVVNNHTRRFLRTASKYMEQRLLGKVALVTGAGRGIGRAIALALAQEGAAVCCAARSRVQLDETVQIIEARGGSALPVVCDVSKSEDTEAAVATAVLAFGGLDILVANAGVSGEARDVESSDPRVWKNTIETNLVGSYLCARAAIPQMKKRGGGKIITMGSGLGHRANSDMSDYACSKAGLWMLTRVLARELEPFGIDVNELVPGPVVTEITAANFAPKLDQPELTGEWLKQPEDVVPMTMFLATQPHRGPTGQSFRILRREV